MSAAERGKPAGPWHRLDRLLARARPHREPLSLLLDAAVVVLAWQATHLFRLGFERWLSARADYDPWVLVGLTLLYVAVLWGLKVPKGVWRFSGFGEVQRIALGAGLELDEAVAKRLRQIGLLDKVAATVAVPEEHLGLLFVDGKLSRALSAGTYAFWNVFRNVVSEVVDLRVQSVEVSGQELLTRDKVSLRVNLAASYRTEDPVTARTKVSKVADKVHITDLHNWAGTLNAKSDVQYPCYRLWLTFTVLWDGRVSLCCADFDGRNVLGDLRTSTIQEIWNSPLYRAARRQHLQTGGPEICRSCDLPKKDSPLWVKKLV